VPSKDNVTNHQRTLGTPWPWRLVAAAAFAAAAIAAVTLGPARATAAAHSPHAHASATPHIAGLRWMNGPPDGLRIEVRVRGARSVRVKLEGAQYRIAGDACRWGKSRWAPTVRLSHERGDLWVAPAKNRRFGRVWAQPLKKWHVAASSAAGTTRKTLYEYSLPCTG